VVQLTPQASGVPLQVALPPTAGMEQGVQLLPQEATLVFSTQASPHRW
jgi:hypothetical protein